MCTSGGKILVMPKRGVGGSDQANLFCGFDSLSKDNKTSEEVMN